MPENDPIKGTIEKALQINLDTTIYGTIVEIGAGQEVARNFFLAGGAAGTVAKTMSAYDMTFSDAIYGIEKDKRYVSQSRVRSMVEREFELVLQRLKNVRDPNTRYFAFADTVVARGYRTQGDCHGWMGLQFQHKPFSRPSKIIMHLRMKDNSNHQQQQAWAWLGLTLFYGAFFFVPR
ncbi:MAG: TonB-dependent receptor, partial [Bacteroidales bacterium]|nr:TonB-dependent receptor [Bacteroidales bacterium]